jgi:tetratricopeptide (TPR) repeat protein
MKTLYKITLFLTLLFSSGLVFAQSEGEFEKGVGLYNQGDYQKAGETLQKLVETDKENRKAWLYLGMSLMRQKENSKAVKAFQKADKIADEKDAKPDAGATKVNITSKPLAAYTTGARQAEIQGTVKLAVEFGADGSILSVVAFQSLPGGLTQNCIESAKRIKFETAKKDGKPYSTIGIVEYKFTIY